MNDILGLCPIRPAQLRHDDGVHTGDHVSMVVPPPSTSSLWSVDNAEHLAGSGCRFCHYFDCGGLGGRGRMGRGSTSGIGKSSSASADVD